VPSSVDAIDRPTVSSATITKSSQYFGRIGTSAHRFRSRDELAVLQLELRERQQRERS